MEHNKILVMLVLGVNAVCCLPLEGTTTTSEKPTPFKFAYSAGRAPGANPDRYVEQEGDEAGVVRGSYTYLDPNWEWQKVEYVADENGFHVDASNLPVANPVAHPQDTAAVAKAKANHEVLYHQIAQTNSQVPVPVVNQDTPVVEAKKAEFANEFARIQEEHARIAAEHAAIAERAKSARLLETALLAQ